MHEKEFRILLTNMFPEVPTYHIKQIVKIVKTKGKEGKFERISRLTGGVI